MIEQLTGTGTFVDVNLEATIEETRQLLRQFGRLLELWFTIGCDQEECSYWCLIQVWRLTLDHLNDHDSQTPHIHLVAVTFPTNTTTSSMTDSHFHAGKKVYTTKNIYCRWLESIIRKYDMPA